MVGHVRAFLQMVQATLPDLLGMLGSARMWAGEETHIENSLYKRIPSVNFSQRVLSAETNKLAVLRLNDVGWSDLGDPGRAMMAVRESGCESRWIREWKFAKRCCALLPQSQQLPSHRGGSNERVRPRDRDPEQD